MLTRIFYIMMILLVMISGCALAPSTANSNEAIKDELQPILSAMLKGNVTDQLALLQYIQAGCTNVPGFGGPPSCPEGVPEGTVVAGFPILGPEGYLVKPEEMEGFLIDILPKNLCAVYRVTPGPNEDAYFPVGEYAMLFERELNDAPAPIILRVMDGKIVRLDYPQVNSLDEILRDIPVEQIVIEPQEAIAWSEESR